MVHPMNLRESYALPSPHLTWRDNDTPYSSEFQDVYYPQEGALQQTYEVFLRGNNLQERWNEKESFSPFLLSELGFGFGLNFLITAHEFRRSAPGSQHLHYISIESSPCEVKDLKRAHSRFPQLQEESQALLSQYPPSLYGTHRLHFSRWNITLDILFGDAQEMLNEHHFCADAWYLDGFSPRTNPSLWQQELFSTARDHSHSQSTFASYSSAGWVRRAIESAGCSIEKASHQNGKRETIHGVFSSAKERVPISTPKSVAVIGGGYAGTVLASKLALSGVSTTLYEREEGLCQRASGNPRGVLLPHITRRPSIDSELYLSGFLYALRFLQQLPLTTPLLHTPGVIHFPSTERLESLWQRFPELDIPLELASRREPKEVSDLLGVSVTSKAFSYPRGGWISPREVAYELTKLAGNRLRIETNVPVAEGTELSSYDALVYANAYEAPHPEVHTDLPTEPVRGQIALVKESIFSSSIKPILCYNGYLLPSMNGEHLIGASYEHGTMDSSYREAESTEMISKLHNWIPEMELSPNAVTGGRVAFRTSTRDRFPIVGPLSYRESESSQRFYFLGFGSRGLTSIPLLAEHLVSEMLGVPSPLPSRVANAVIAERFRRKRLFHT
jgi:tRNA 5-methylaminomethyl-2-thiouridine biosynthesis bifunctional protein